jgi:hypothetical protein
MEEVDSDVSVGRLGHIVNPYLVRAKFYGKRDSTCEREQDK